MINAEINDKDALILKKQGHKCYESSYLKTWTKEELIGLIRCLEHNWAAAEEKNENQFKLLMKYDFEKNANHVLR